METLVKVNKKEVNGIIIFTIRWELDETNADKTFKDIYEQIGDFKNKKVIFNLDWVKYVNSKSIGYIADIFSNIEDNDWKMCICCPNESVKDILELVGITTIVLTVDTEEEAIKELS